MGSAPSSLLSTVTAGAASGGLHTSGHHWCPLSPHPPPLQPVPCLSWLPPGPAHQPSVRSVHCLHQPEDCTVTLQEQALACTARRLLPASPRTDPRCFSAMLFNPHSFSEMPFPTWSPLQGSSTAFVLPGTCPPISRCSPHDLSLAYRCGSPLRPGAPGGRGPGRSASEPTVQPGAHTEQEELRLA